MAGAMPGVATMRRWTSNSTITVQSKHEHIELITGFKTEEGTGGTLEVQIDWNDPVGQSFARCLDAWNQTDSEVK